MTSLRPRLKELNDNPYFNRSGSWLYHKLDGIDGNKKPTAFTEEEREAAAQRSR